MSSEAPPSGGGNGAGAGAGAGAGVVTTNGDQSFMYRGSRMEIREVWSHNLDEEMAVIRDLVDKYPYVAMDTEFPGVIARPIGAFASHTEFHYQTLRCNVDMLNMIQLGLTFADEQGKLVPHCPTWQFNFQFDLERDMYAQDSIDLLKRSGIQFNKLKTDGIDPFDFGELLVPSGLVLNPNVKWLSFHSGYDFGYLLKQLTCVPLPSEEAKFFRKLRTWFPHIYDVKHLMTGVDSLKGGLNKLASDLRVERAGPVHQAGSDSLLTSAVFFEMKQRFFGGTIDDARVRGVLYGLGGKPA